MQKNLKSASLVDFSMMSLQFGNDQEILFEFITSYIEEWPTYIENIETALSQKNADDVFASTHKFKGVFGNLYCQTVMQKIDQLELSAKKNDLEAAHTLLRQILPDLERIQDSLDAWLKIEGSLK